LTTLVFIHGWGLAPDFWNRLAPLLPGTEQHRVNLGFYGEPAETFPGDDCVLIGHSLGFVYGMAKKKNWRGWIAINSFPRFVGPPGSGCASLDELKDMASRLEKNPAETLKKFYAFIGAEPPAGYPDLKKLREALDMLRILAVGRSAIPGLMLAARNDCLVPEATGAALAAGHSAEWHESGGHVLPQSDPAWCAERISSFLKQNFREAA